MNTQSLLRQQIKQLTKYLGITPTELARQIGTDAPQINQLGTPRKPSISKDLIVKVVKRFPEVEPWWLLTGEGPMLREKKYPDVVGEPTVEYNPGPESWLDGFKAQMEDYERRIAQLEADAKEKDDQIRNLVNDMRLLLKDGRTNVGGGEES